MAQQYPSNIELDKLIAGDGEAIDHAETMLTEQLQRHPEWAEFVLPFLASGQPTLVVNARHLLTLFDEEALLTIARGFEVDDASARFAILGVLWAHLIAMDPHDRQYWIESVAPYLSVGLSDTRTPNRYFADPEHMELENDYRICDETYLFINRLMSDDFDDSRFAVLEEDARTAVVQQFDRRSATLFSSPAVAARKAARQPAALAELTIITNFTTEFEAQTAQFERDQAVAKKWAPALRDFRAVAAVDTPQPTKAIFEVGSFLEMLSAILFVDPSKPKTSAFRPAQSVKRVNIITHGNPGLIAMSGTVDKNGGVMLTTHPSSGPDLLGPIDVAAVQLASDPNLQLDNGKPLAQSLRDRFAPDAEIFLIACHSAMGLSLPLMQDMKALFKTKIQAFSKEIAYCPSLDATHIIDRAFTAIEKCDNGSTRGYKHLVPDRTV